MGGAILACFILLAVAAPRHVVHGASLESRVNEAFRGVFGQQPTPVENAYWLGRVADGDKTTFAALQGAMYYQKALGRTTGAGRVAVTSTTATAKPKKEDKNNLIKDTLTIFIGIYRRDPTNAEKAWWRKRIACGEIASTTALKKSMAFHKAKKTGKGSDGICGQKAAAAAAPSGILRRAVAGISSHPMGDSVRIGIHSTNGKAIDVTADGKYQIREGQAHILATLGKDDVVHISWSNGKYHVRGSGMNLNPEEEVRIVPLDGAIVQIKNYSDPSATYAGKNYNRFRGIVEIRMSNDRKQLWAITELRTEYYLRGLAETSGDGPEEYLKALGVAARTYVLYHKVVTGGRYINGGFDIDNTPNDQIYRGYEFEIITPRLASIFNKVKGVIAADSEADKPVTTVYFSDSDGRTRTAKEVWGTNRFPHLQQSVKDPHHAASACKGHCVGMSAQGAYGFAAKDNWNFRKILSYYYKGIKLVKAY